MNAPAARLLACATGEPTPMTLALAGVIGRAAYRTSPYDRPIAGLDRPAMAALLARFFPALPAHEAEPIAAACAGPVDDRGDEFHDLIALLAEHASADDEPARWLAHAVATASMAENHLWQDLGLPSRGVLNALLAQHFPALHAKNVGDMKWKKFFYRQLCERAEVLICKSPSCGECVDYAVCFGPETAATTRVAEVQWMPSSS